MEHVPCLPDFVLKKLPTDVIGQRGGEKERHWKVIGQMLYSSYSEWTNQITSLPVGLQYNNEKVSY